jgi:hypothetical protein
MFHHRLFDHQMLAWIFGVHATSNRGRVLGGRRVDLQQHGVHQLHRANGHHLGLGLRLIVDGQRPADRWAIVAGGRQRRLGDRLIRLPKRSQEDRISPRGRRLHRAGNLSGRTIEQSGRDAPRVQLGPGAGRDLGQGDVGSARPQDRHLGQRLLRDGGAAARGGDRGEDGGARQAAGAPRDHGASSRIWRA